MKITIGKYGLLTTVKVDGEQIYMSALVQKAEMEHLRALITKLNLPIIVTIEQEKN